MRTVTFLLLFAVLVTFTACAIALTDAGKAVRVMKSDPPSNCREIGGVTGSAGGLQGDPKVIQNAKNDMRNNAAKMGANYVRFETASINSVTGTAYRCP